MQQLVEIENRLQQLKPLLSDRFHVSKIGLFGSYVSGKATVDSDLDLLVEFSQPIGWDFFILEQFLEEELKLNIDLVTKDSLKERIKGTILKQVKYI